MTKYLSSEPFSSAPANANYQRGWERTFAERESLPLTLVQCPRCRLYFQRRAGPQVCPKGCAFEHVVESLSKDLQQLNMDDYHEHIYRQEVLGGKP